MSRVAVVVVAAGSSVRFGRDKLAVPLAGRSVLERALAAMRTALPEAPVALVVRAEAVADVRERWGEAVLAVGGGIRRQDSVRNGVEALGLADDDLVLIHDGARPFVPVADVLAVASATAGSGAALLVAPVVDTVKRLDGSLVRETVSRTDLARALTPQGFRVGVLRRAWAAAGERDWTDEAALVESIGQDVRAVQGDPRNVKVTRPEDVDLVRALYPRELRVGQGFDVHPLVAGRPLWLCGVEVPSDVGLAGHSDADAALHAVTDAILGACGLGDIGEHFPPTDERWRDASSDRFVRHAIVLSEERGWSLVNCDLTILAERPRISPHRAAMRARLAEVLGVGEERVNLKATTTERLGFVGRSEGVVATAVVLLESS